MVLSTDPAHSLADAFGIELGNLPVEVTAHLWGQQLDAQQRMEDSWSDIQAYLMEIFDWAGVDAGAKIFVGLRGDRAGSGARP